MNCTLATRYVNDRHGRPLAVVDGFPGLGAELRAADAIALALELTLIAGELGKRGDNSARLSIDAAITRKAIS